MTPNILTSDALYSRLLNLIPSLPTRAVKSFHITGRAGEKAQVVIVQDAMDSQGDFIVNDGKIAEIRRYQTINKSRLNDAPT